MRTERGATQSDMVRDTGIPLATYQRMEAGIDTKTGKRLDLNWEGLYNCAIVLEVEIDDLIDDDKRQWHEFSHLARNPPETPSWRLPRDDEEGPATGGRRTRAPHK